METDTNSIMMHIGAILSIFGLVSCLVVGHYYSKKAASKKKLTRIEFNKGVILFAVAFFVSIAPIGGTQLIVYFLEPESVSVTEMIMTSFLCLIFPPLFAAGAFIWEFKRKGWVEKKE